MKEVNLTLADDIDELVKTTMELHSSTNYVNVLHGPVSQPGDSLITMSRKDAKSKKFLSFLATQGFYLYRVTDHGSRFVRDHTIGDLWHRVKDGDFLVSKDGLVYSYTPPVVETSSNRMLVIFSSMSTSIYNPSLMRYFEQNFSSAQKHVPPNTAILRIADIGGIVGAFYLNTVRNPDNTTRIRRLISDVAALNGISFRDIVLYGASKGGTGALYHGLTSGLTFIAVDPVLSDEHYVTTYQDSHFTTDGVFIERKQDVFTRLVDSLVESHSQFAEPASRGAVIYSERSPQFLTIEELATEKLRGVASFFNCINPEIKDHPDVSPKSVNTAAMLMNMFFYDLPVQPGVRKIV